MVNPIRYDVAPVDIMGNLQAGQNFRLSGESAALANRKLNADIAEQQRNIQMQRDFSRDLGGLMNNYSPQGVADMYRKYPAMQKSVESIVNSMDEMTKKRNLNYASTINSALDNNDIETAKNLINERISDAELRGDALSKTQFEMIKKSIDNGNTNGAKIDTSAFIAASLGPEEYAQTYSKLRKDAREDALHPSKMLESRAKANKAAIESEYIEDQIVSDFEEQGIRVSGMLDDKVIKRENLKIAKLNSKLKKETNDLKRQEVELKIEKAKQDRAQELRDRVAMYKGQSSTINNSLELIDKITAPENRAILEAVTGPYQGRELWPSVISATFPGGVTDEQASSMISDIKTLLSQNFLNSLSEAKEKGATFGGLTESEGRKLEMAWASIDRTQGTDNFIGNLLKIQRILRGAQSNLAEKYNINEEIQRGQLKEIRQEVTDFEIMP